MTDKPPIAVVVESQQTTDKLHCEAIEFDKSSGFVVLRDVRVAADEYKEMVLLDREHIRSIEGGADDLQQLVDNETPIPPGLQTRSQSDVDNCPECGNDELTSTLGGMQECLQCGHSMQR